MRWLSKLKWQDWKKIELLAGLLYKYSKYLEAQNKMVLTLQHDSVPACSISDQCWGRYF